MLKVSRLIGWMFLFLTIQLFSENLYADNVKYILYLRPGGELGDQLRQFWKNIKKQNLDDPAVLNYPPHCSLTGFFSGSQSQEMEYISALKEAVDDTNPIYITITSKTVHQGPKLDYIPLKSSDLLSITTNFVKLIGISSDYIKGKTGFGYHISLREDTDAKTTVKVRKLEDKYINLKAKKLAKNTTWALYLYRKVDDQLTEIFRMPIPTN